MELFINYILIAIWLQKIYYSHFVLITTSIMM